MSTNKAQILKQAQTFMAKGQLDKAISEWEKLLTESPNDGNIYNTIGDLYLKKKDSAHSIEAYLKAADVFHESGFDLKTIAVYKKILKINPKQHDVYLKLGDLNAERGLTGNAVSDYVTLARKFTDEKKILEAIDIYRKILVVDAQNTNVRLKIAELLLKEGLQGEAVKEYLTLAEVYEATGRTKDTETVYKHILKIDPENQTAKLGLHGESPKPETKTAPAAAAPVPPPVEELPPHKLAQAAFEKGRFDEALSRYGKLAASEPSNLDYQEKLGKIHLKQGYADKAFPIYISVSEQLIEGGDPASGVRLIQEFLGVEPDRIEAHRVLALGLERMGQQDKAIAEYVHLIEAGLGTGEMESARSFYEKIKAWDPDHEEIRRLRPNFEAEPSEPAVEAAIPEPALETEEPVASGEPLPSMQSILESTLHSAEASESGGSSLSGGKALDPAAVNDLFVEAEVYIKYGLADKAIDQLKQVIAVSPDHIEAHISLKETLHHENRTAEAADTCVSLAIILKGKGDLDGYRLYMAEAAELDPNNSRLKGQRELEKVLETDSMQDILTPQEEEEPASPPSETPVRESQSSSKARMEGEAALSSLWEEEFQPVASEAPAQPAVPHSKAPEEDFVFEDELEKSFAALEPTPAPPADVREISLEEELEQTFTSIIGGETTSTRTGAAADDTHSLDQSSKKPTKPSLKSEELELSIVSKYHDQEGTVVLSGEDIETHYNLGIAYSEMGLVNDAIAEFKIASRSADRFVDAQSMLAACYRKKGKSPQAIEALEKALSAPQCGEKERKWLTYELASVFESESRFEEALRLYTEIYDQDPAFKDVGERVEELRKKTAGAPARPKGKKSVRDKDEDISNLVEEFFENTLSEDSQKDEKNEKKKKSRISYL